MIPAAIAMGVGTQQLFETAKTVIEGASAATAGVRAGLHAATHTSLTHQLKTTMIPSRVYIDGTIGNDPIVPDVIRAAHSMYLSLVLNALQLDQLVANGRTVQEMLKAVATEHLMSEHKSFADKFAQYCGLESDDNKDKGKGGGYYSSDGGEFSKLDAGKFLGGKPIKQDESGHMPFGRLVEIELRGSNDPHAPSAKIQLLVQMLPYHINPAISVEFIKLDAKPGFWQRLLMLKAGEISFFKDFLFSMDIYKHKQKILKADVDGILATYLAEQVRKDVNSFGTVFGAMANGKASVHNISNSVMIFAEETVKRAKAETGFDLHSVYDRNRYFRETYAMLIYVVDPMFNTVTLYMNGIAAVGEYTFDAFQPKGKSNDVVNLLAAIQAMSQGQAPRF